MSLANLVDPEDKEESQSGSQYGPRKRIMTASTSSSVSDFEETANIESAEDAERRAALLEGLSPDERRKVQNREAQRKSRANREKQIERLEAQ
ncbi:hypothetical protein HDU98_005924, partial [Podochytrium sp. JEL0797]